MKKAVHGAYIVTHPIGAAKNALENSLLDALAGGGRSRRGGGAYARRQGYVYTPSSSPNSYAAAAERAELAAQIEASERWVFSQHLEPVRVASPKRAPEVGRPDETAARARIAASLGVPDLERRLAPYGNPPCAPKVELGDLKSLEREIHRALVEDLPVRRIGQRRAAQVEARRRAAEEYAAELKRSEEGRETLQTQLDQAASELAELRGQVDASCQEWIREQTERLEQSRAAQQRVYDDEWQKLQSNDPPTVVSALREAFTGEAVSALGGVDGTALIVVACPEPEQIIADQEPAVTAAGRPTVHKRSKTQVNDLYAAAIGSRTLAAVKRALAAAPALDAVASVAIRPSESPEHDWEAIYLGIFERDVVDELQGTCWSDDPDDILEAVDRPNEVSYDAGGRTHELKALPLDDDAELRAVIERMDDRAQERADRANMADQMAAEAFLRGSSDETPGPEVVAEPQIEVRRAAVLQRADHDADPVQVDREFSHDEDSARRTDPTSLTPEARSLKPKLVRPQAVQPGLTEADDSAHNTQNAPDTERGSRTAKLRRYRDELHD